LAREPASQRGALGATAAARREARAAPGGGRGCGRGQWGAVQGAACAVSARRRLRTCLGRAQRSDATGPLAGRADSGGGSRTCVAPSGAASQPPSGLAARLRPSLNHRSRPSLHPNPRWTTSIGTPPSARGSRAARRRASSRRTPAPARPGGASTTARRARRWRWRRRTGCGAICGTTTAGARAGWGCGPGDWQSGRAA
jgi:hypothetical protein